MAFQNFAGLSLFPSNSTSVAGGTSPDTATNSGASSILYGNSCSSTGNNCATFGLSCSTSASAAFAAGSSCSAAGIASVALGNGATASAATCFAFGRTVTAANAGSFVIADNTGTNTSDTAINQFAATFANGFFFYVGATLAVNIDSADNLINLKGTADQSTSYQAPSTGFSITIGAGVKTLMLTNTGTLATGTITMPAAPIDGQEIRVSMRGTVTTLTVSANAGQTITNAPVTITSGLGFAYIYRGSTNIWYRLY
jgi:hypothetical protein